MEGRSEAPKTKQISETTEMKALRTLVNRELRHGMKNENITDQCKIPLVNNWIRVRSIHRR